MIDIETIINSIYHDIQLNFGSSDVKRTVIKQSSELTHILRIRLYDNTGEITINPAWNFMISAIKADNTHILNQLNISIVDNAIEITMTKQMLASPGTMRCEIAIQDSSKKALYSDTFFIYVDPNVQDGSYIESTDEFDSIVQAMDKVNKMKDHVEEVKDHVDDMAESIEETYEELKDAVDTTQGLIKENEKINETEKTREANENTRKTNEQQRQSNEQQRQDNTSAAIKNAEAATKNANGAAADVQEKLKSLESQTYTHPDSGVTPGTYKSVTVDKQGHVTSGTNPTTLSGYGITDAASKSHTHDYVPTNRKVAGKVLTSDVTLSASDVGLGDVPNVSTNKQTPTFSQASTRTNIASGNTLSTILGKIMKYFADLKTVAFSGNYSDLSGTPSNATSKANGLMSSSDKEKLDNIDYQEGTWTPSPKNGSNVAISTTAAAGRYIKIGALVYISGYMSFSVTGTLVSISGLPYSACPDGGPSNLSSVLYYHNANKTVNPFYQTTQSSTLTLSSLSVASGHSVNIFGVYRAL